MTTTFKHDPAEIRAWATQHGIEVADAPEPAPAEPAPAEPALAVETGPGSEPAAEPAGFRGSGISPGARAELDRLARDARLVQMAEERERVTLARRHARLSREAADYETEIARLTAQAGPLADQVARLTREAEQLDQRLRITRAGSARQAAEDERAAALARRVVQVLEGDKALDPFTAALAALAQNKRRLGEIAPEDDPRLAALAEAVQEAAGRRARVIQLQNRQITVNRTRGPDSAEADAVRRELAAERLAMVVLATLGSGLDSDGILSVVLTGSLPGNAGPPRFLTDPDWPVTG